MGKPVTHLLKSQETDDDGNVVLTFRCGKVEVCETDGEGVFSPKSKYQRKYREDTRRTDFCKRCVRSILAERAKKAGKPNGTVYLAYDKTNGTIVPGTQSALSSLARIKRLVRQHVSHYQEKGEDCEVVIYTGKASLRIATEMTLTEEMYED